MDVEETCDAVTKRTRLGWPDYCVLGSMLTLSLAVGLFYGVVRKKGNTTSEFFLGSRQMTFFPAAMSLANSILSAVTFLALPAEMYIYGTQYAIAGFRGIFTSTIIAFLYVPVFRKLTLTSSYEYLKLRFNSFTRLLASGMFLAQSILYSPIAAYAPALALSQATGLDIYLSVGITLVVCVLYTSIGGIKAVIWTDTVQGCIIICTLIAVIVRGLIDVGGFSTVWERNENSGRIEFFNMNPDPTIRHTFWIVLVGGGLHGITLVIGSQGAMQRCLSTKTVKEAQKTMVIYGVIASLLYLLTCFIGILVFAKYYTCDPLLSKKIKNPDQIVPFFVMDVMGEYPGFVGLFVAGILSGSLSTLSTILNSLATITMEDFVAFKWKMPEEKVLRFAKWVSVLYGVLCFAMVFLVPYFGVLNQMVLTVTGMVCGTLGGLFTLGMFYPWCNSKGASTGVIVSMLFVFWIAINAQIAREGGLIVYPRKPLSVDGCACNVSLTPITQTPPSGDVFPLYKISYLWYAGLGMSTTIVVGIAVSFLTKFEDPRSVNPDLLSPTAIWFFSVLPKRIRTALKLPDYKCESKNSHLQSDEPGVMLTSYAPTMEKNIVQTMGTSS